MKKKVKIFVALLIAVVVLFSLTAVACGESGSECTSICPICGLCTDPDCTEHKDKCQGHEEEKAEVVSAEVVIQPSKVAYYPGEIFDPTGLGVKATLSNGKTKNYFDMDFTEWTHKGEPLTDDITKITFTIPGTEVTFDVAITVSVPEDLIMTVDTSSLQETYLTTDTIDFSTIVVKVTTGGKTTTIGADMWSLWEADTQITDISAVTLPEGEHTMTVKYLTEFSKDFTVIVNDPAAVINPSFVEAEQSVYWLGENGDETSDPYTIKENVAVCEYYDEDGVCVTGRSLPSGASGDGASSSLDGSNTNPPQNGDRVYFKFTVNVPDAGTYKLFARVQGTAESRITDKFVVNINGKTGENGELEFVASTSQDYVRAGNQLSKYADTQGKEYTTWRGMFWWNMVCIGDYELQEGENTFRIRMPNAFAGNIDYFEVRESDYVYEPQLFSMRTGSRVDLTDNAIYLEKGQKLTDLVLTPELHPAKYTLIYIRLADGQEVPVLESMLSEIDYEHVGEQTVTVTCGEATAQFKLVIEDSGSDF